MGSQPPLTAPTSGSRSRRQFLRLSMAGTTTAALAAAGCSNFRSSSNRSDEGAQGGGPFTFTFWGTGGEKAAVTKVVNDFAEANGLTPNAQSISTAYETKLNTLIAANTPPDAGYLTGGLAMRLGEQGKIVSVVGKSGFDEYLPAALHHWSADQAVSQTAVEVMALWYDTDATTNAGVTPPASSDDAWTFDALAEAADKLTADENGRTPSDSGFDRANVARYGLAAPTSLPSLVALLKSNGVDLFDDEGTKTNIDSPEAIEVLQSVADLIFKHRVAPTPAQATTFGASTALLLASKRVVMAIDGQWALQDLAETQGLNFDVAVLPVFDHPVTTIIGGASGVFAGSKHRDAALQLLVDMGDPTKVPLYANGLWMPLQQKYYTDEAAIASWVDNDAHPKSYRTAVIAPTLDNPVPFPGYKIKNWTIVETTLNNGLTPMFTKEIDIATAAHTLRRQVDKLMQGAYPDVIK